MAGEHYEAESSMDALALPNVVQVCGTKPFQVCLFAARSHYCLFAAQSHFNELLAGGGADLEPDGGGVTVGDEGDFSGASPCGASGESDEWGMTSAGGGGGEVRVLLDVLGKIWESEPSDGGGGEASGGGSDIAKGEAAGGEGGGYAGGGDDGGGEAVYDGVEKP
ncbi:hypothetical protein ACFX2B_008360 [Malus domestica]